MKKFIPLFVSALMVELSNALILWGLGSLLTLILNAYVGAALPFLPFWAYLMAVFIIVVIADLLHVNRQLSDSLKRMKTMEAIAKEARKRQEAESEYSDYDYTGTDEDEE